MANALTLVEGVIRPSLTAELDSFRAANHRVSSYYLNLRPPSEANGEAARIALKNALARERERIDQLEDARPAVRHALHRDWELVSTWCLP